MPFFSGKEAPVRLFDLHCDTLTACAAPLLEAPGHLSLRRGAALEQWTQVFAVFVPDSLDGPAAQAHFARYAAAYEAQLGELRRCCTPLLALENGSALNGDLAQLERWAGNKTAPLRIITLTWNGANALGHGAHCDPVLGLTPFGRAAVAHMHALGVWPDVSHLNEAGFWEVCALSRQHSKPLLATHSCCMAVHPHRRSLNDRQLQAIFASGGLVGLNLYRAFLGGAGDARAVAAHLRHLCALGGEAHAALGSDFDGCTIHPSLAGVEKLEQLDWELGKHGISAALRQKFFWENAARFFGS
jgi:membrane dipeptidase